jgi:hypothetical protein
MDVLASVINGKELWQTVAAAFVGAMTVSLVASIGIWGGARYVDLNQEGRTLHATLALIVGVLGLVATVGIIALGIYLMVAK